jgi:hypothetical protein
MALSSSRGFAQWVYGIGRSRHGRHGKTGTRRGSSVRSGGIVLTMLLCSANEISAICSIPTKNITMRLVRTYRCTRTRRSPVASRLSVARWRSQFWAGCITNISEHKFPTGTTPATDAAECQAVLFPPTRAHRTGRSTASLPHSQSARSQSQLYHRAWIRGRACRLVRRGKRKRRPCR